MEGEKWVFGHLGTSLRAKWPIQEESVTVWILVFEHTIYLIQPLLPLLETAEQEGNKTFINHFIIIYIYIIIMINKKTTRYKLFMVLCLFFNKTKLTLKRQFLFVVVD